MDVPDVSYARSGDVSIAYQEVGNGSSDLVFLPFLSNLFTLWYQPREVHDGKVAGIAVSMGARVSAAVGPGEVLVSSTVKDLVAGSGIEFEDRGTHELKGVPGEWRLFAVLSP